MICPSCGAEYDDSSLMCPYCHSENSSAAREEKQRLLESYDKEADEIRREADNYPKQAAKKITRYLLAGLAAVLVLGLLVTVLYLCFGRRQVNADYRQEKVNLEKLEELYGAGSYEDLTAYIKDHDIWGRTYDKYLQVADLCGGCESMQSYEAEVREIFENSYLQQENKESLAEYWIECFLGQAYQIAADTEEYTQDSNLLGNEQILKTYYGTMLTLLEPYGVSGEDLQEIGEKGDDTWNEVLERLKQGFYSQMGGES
jgi:hypothetical protein